MDHAQLAAEIASIVLAPTADGYMSNDASAVHGQWICHCGYYRLRLFRRNACTNVSVKSSGSGDNDSRARGAV